MAGIVDLLSELGQGQTARFALDGGEDLEARVNQRSFSGEEYLRLELSSDDERYQLRSRYEDGEWSPVELRRRNGTDWTAMGTVEAVSPSETFGTVKSADMEAQEDTGTWD